MVSDNVEVVGHPRCHVKLETSCNGTLKHACVKAFSQNLFVRFSLWLLSSSLKKRFIQRGNKIVIVMKSNFETTTELSKPSTLSVPNDRKGACSYPYAFWNKLQTLIQHVYCTMKVIHCVHTWMSWEEKLRFLRKLTGCLGKLHARSRRHIYCNTNREDCW